MSSSRICDDDEHEIGNVMEEARSSEFHETKGNDTSSSISDGENLKYGGLDHADHQLEIPTSVGPDSTSLEIGDSM